MIQAVELLCARTGAENFSLRVDIGKKFPLAVDLAEAVATVFLSSRLSINAIIRRFRKKI
jgi:hypothetical protein